MHAGESTTQSADNNNGRANRGAYRASDPEKKNIAAEKPQSGEAWGVERRQNSKQKEIKTSHKHPIHCSFLPPPRLTIALTAPTWGAEPFWDRTPHVFLPPFLLGTRRISRAWAQVHSAYNANNLGTSVFPRCAVPTGQTHTFSRTSFFLLHTGVPTRSSSVCFPVRILPPSPSLAPAFSFPRPPCLCPCKWP